MKRVFILLLATTFCFVAADACAKINLSEPPEVPPELVARDFKELSRDRNALLEQLYVVRGKIDRQEENCRRVEEGSNKVGECIAEANAVIAAAKEYRAAVKRFESRIAEALAWKKFITDMARQTSMSTNHNPHAIGIESHGEFHVIASDGRRLSPQDVSSLTENDDVRLVTGSDSRAFLTLTDNTRLKLGPNTELLTIAKDLKPEPNERPTKELIKGTFRWLREVWSEKKKILTEPGALRRLEREGKIRVVEPIASVRGTEFEGAVLPDGSGQIKLYSGEVSVTSKTGEVVTLKPGQMVIVYKDKIGPVTQIP